MKRTRSRRRQRSLLPNWTRIPKCKTWMRYAPGKACRMTFSPGAQGAGVLATSQVQLPGEPRMEKWVLNKASWLSNYPSSDSTEPLSSWGSKGSFTGKDLKAVQVVVCDLPPSPRGSAPRQPRASSQGTLYTMSFDALELTPNDQPFPVLF